MTTPIAEAPQLPESVRTYDSNGHVSSAKVAWDAIRIEQYAKEGVFTVNGRLEGTQLTTKLHVRVSAQTEQGANISDQWTGSNCHLPLLQIQIQATQFQMLMTSSFPTITNQPIVGQTGIVVIQKLQSVFCLEIQVS